MNLVYLLLSSISINISCSYSSEFSKGLLQFAAMIRHKQLSAKKMNRAEDIAQ